MIQKIKKAALLAAITFSAGSALASHSWSTYHWATTTYPIPLEVIDSVTSDWQFELEVALDEWNANGVFGMTITSSDEARNSRKRCSAVTGKMKVCNADYGFNGWLGLASINLDNNGHIVQGTAKMNDSYSSSFADPNQRRHVMCQEIGHVFGLGHTSEDGSSQNTCMDYSNSPNSISPNAHDYNMLDAIYDHVDSYNSWVAGGSSCTKRNCRNSGATNGADIPPMGIRVTGNDRHEIWVSEDGRGGYWIHHLTLPFGDHDHDH